MTSLTLGKQPNFTSLLAHTTQHGSNVQIHGTLSVHGKAQRESTQKQVSVTEMHVVGITQYWPPSQQMQQMRSSFTSWIGLQQDYSHWQQQAMPSILTPQHAGYWKMKPQMLQQQAWQTRTSPTGTSLKSQCMSSLPRLPSASPPAGKLMKCLTFVQQPNAG